MTRRELRRENEELREALGLRGYRTIEEWELLPAAIRDPLATWFAQRGYQPSYRAQQEFAVR
jgi:hypothetical protein